MQPTYTLSGNVVAAQATPRMQGSYRQPISVSTQQLAQLLPCDSSLTPASQNLYLSGSTSSQSSNILTTIDEETFLSLAKNIQVNSASNVSDNAVPAQSSGIETSTTESDNSNIVKMPF